MSTSYDIFGLEAEIFGADNILLADWNAAAQLAAQWEALMGADQQEADLQAAASDCAIAGDDARHGGR
jgi:hypothetical protein